jgi:hypothetical protein
VGLVLGDQLADCSLHALMTELRQVEETVDRRGRKLGLAAVPSSFIRLQNPLTQQP